MEIKNMKIKSMKLTRLKNVYDKNKILKYLKRHNAEELYEEGMNKEDAIFALYRTPFSTKIAKQYLERYNALTLYKEGQTMKEAEKLYGLSNLSNNYVKRFLKSHSAMYLYHNKMTLDEMSNVIKNSKRYNKQRCVRLLMKEFGPKGGDYYGEGMDLGFIIDKIIKPRRERGIGAYCGKQIVIFHKIYTNLKCDNNSSHL